MENPLLLLSTVEEMNPTAHSHHHSVQRVTPDISVVPVSFTKNARVRFGLCFFLAARAKTGRQKNLFHTLPHTGKGGSHTGKGGSQTGKGENQFHV